jgi:predicted Kef-type K+ transport protein
MYHQQKTTLTLSKSLKKIKDFAIITHKMAHSKSGLPINGFAFFYQPKVAIGCPRADCCH